MNLCAGVENVNEQIHMTSTNQRYFRKLSLPAGVALGLMLTQWAVQGAEISGWATWSEGPSYDLTALGTVDWAHWGHGGSDPSFDHKSTGGGQISDLTQIAASGKPFGVADPAPKWSVSWTDGTPTASATADGRYYYTEGLGNGWSLTVPADTSPRKFFLLCGGWGTHGTLTAELSDGSAAAYSVDLWDTSAPNPETSMEHYSYLVQINYQAAAAGQTLTIRYIKAQNDPRWNSGSVDIKAAWLVLGGEPVVSMIEPADNAIYNAGDPIPVTADASDAEGTIAKVEFYNGTDLIHTDTTSPYTFIWNNAPMGVRTLTAKATDNSGLSAVSAPVTVLVQGSGGTLSGAVNPTSAYYDLSAVGIPTLDWAHWGRGQTYGNFDHKSTGGGRISDATPFGAGTAGGYGEAAFNRFVGWSDGAPTETVADEMGYIYFDSSEFDCGYWFTVPADTTERTVYLFAGGNWCYGQVQARLSDLSAPDYAAETQGNPTGNYEHLHRITYRAASAGQTLKVSLRKLSAGGSIDLISAWLVDGNPGDPPARPVISEPAANTSLSHAAPIAVAADATDPDGSIARMEFFANGTLIGTDTSSPYSISWTAAPGAYNLAAKAIDNRGLNSMSIKTPVFVVGGNGLIDGKSEPASTAGYDLTLLGAGDWAHWGGGSSFTGFDHKSAGGNKISDITAIGPSATVEGNLVPTFNRFVSWTDGTPTPSAAMENTYVYSDRNGIDNGFMFTVPADTSPRTLFVYAGGSWSFSRTEASLSDFSAMPHLGEVHGVGNDRYEYIERINYRAASAGQTLTVKVVKTGTGVTGGGSVDLIAAWLVEGSPPTVAIDSPADGATFASPANITISASASDADGAVAKVEFFDGATRIGEVTTSPYSIEWNNAPIGTHALTAKATDNDGEFSLSVPVTIMVTTTGGQLASTASPAGAAYDLSAQNASDWVVWGREGSYDNLDRKAAGGNQIGALDHMGDPVYGSNLDTNVLVSWNDGAPTASSLDEAGYIFNRGAYLTVDSGWSFTVPADTTSRMLYLLCGAGGGGVATPEVTLTAHLSDGSAPDFVDVQAGSVDPYWRLIAIDYKAGAPNQTLTITYVKTAGVQAGSRVNLKAAWLIGPPPPAPPVCQSIQVNGSNLQITFSTSNPGATHAIEQSASIVAPSWSAVPSAAFSSGPGGTLVATFGKPAESVMFYRVVQQ